MKRPAFLVEGHLEQRFVQAVCPGSSVLRLNCNGDKVAIEAVAKRVGTLGRRVHKKCSVLVVVFDQEGRDSSAVELEASLRKALECEALQVPVVVGIPDRSMESWILADPVSFRESSGTPPLPTDEALVAEGERGKPLIRKLLGPGRSYVETIEGVAWLLSAKASVMRKRSASFRRFATNLSELRCPWLGGTPDRDPTGAAAAR